eukprot:GHUV01038321.1.p1 GENE.GHUV01038321.1~~GHUV01038321.1.p1  ORF type:complete len:126 (+),score=25.90 GHUV01038321.1:143-520(+)
MPDFCITSAPGILLCISQNLSLPANQGWVFQHYMTLCISAYIPMLLLAVWCCLQGEYVAAEKLELAYQHAPAAEQVWVYGDSFKSSLVAVVVPKKDAVLDWAKSAGKQGEPQRPACCQCCYKPVV